MTIKYDLNKTPTAGPRGDHFKPSRKDSPSQHTEVTHLRLYLFKLNTKGVLDII